MKRNGKAKLGAKGGGNGPAGVSNFYFNSGSQIRPKKRRTTEGNNSADAQAVGALVRLMDSSLSVSRTKEAIDEVKENLRSVQKLLGPKPEFEAIKPSEPDEEFFSNVRGYYVTRRKCTKAADAEAYDAGENFPFLLRRNKRLPSFDAILKGDSLRLREAFCEELEEIQKKLPATKISIFQPLCQFYFRIASCLISPIVVAIAARQVDCLHLLLFPAEEYHPLWRKYVLYMMSYCYPYVHVAYNCVYYGTSSREDYRMLEMLTQYTPASNLVIDIPPAACASRESPLHLAAMQNDIRLAKFLIDKGLVVNKPANFAAVFECAIQMASFRGHDEMVSILCDRFRRLMHRLKKENIGQKIRRDYVTVACDPLPLPLFAAYSANEKTLLFFLNYHEKLHPLTFDFTDYNGAHLVHYAAQNGVQVFERLIDVLAKAGRYDNSWLTKSDKDGRTPLCFAIETGDMEMVKHLVRRMDVSPLYSLCRAIVSRKRELVDFLLDSVEERYPPSRCATEQRVMRALCLALWTAVFIGDVGTAKRLLQMGVHIHYQPDGYSWSTERIIRKNPELKQLDSTVRGRRVYTR